MSVRQRTCWDASRTCVGVAPFGCCASLEPGARRGPSRCRPPGKLGAEFEAGSDFRFVVHQASGMVSGQLDVSVGEALIRVRARAFAEDVVARRLASPRALCEPGRRLA